MWPAPARNQRLAPNTLYCPNCRLAPHNPVTGQCGHTRCSECVVMVPYCPCGELYHGTFNVDVLCSKLMELVQQTTQPVPRRLLVNGRGRISKRALSRPHRRSSNGLTNQITPDGSPRFRPINYASVDTNQYPKYMERLRAELQCAVCCQSLRRPVGTPCGHTFCRECIERAMDFGHSCPLCKFNLLHYNTDAWADSANVVLALRAAGLPLEPPPPPIANEEVPLFLCTVAYPNIFCPLHVFEPRYRLMLRRVMRSASRRFGMVPVGPRADYGTLLELRDVLRLRDGRCFATTVGVARFRVVSRREQDGYHVAQVRILSDLSNHADSDYTDIMTRMCTKMHHWLQARLSPQTRAEILESYGPMPPPTACSNADASALCWWLLAIMPLPSAVKVTMLGTVCPMRRLWVLEHLLTFIETETTAGPVPGA